MLSPDSLTSNEKKAWEMRKETGRWQKGVTAGGCRNYIDTFHTNPQFRYVEINLLFPVSY